MGNLKEKVGLMLRTLGTKTASNFGSLSATNIAVHDDQMVPKGSMTLAEFAKAIKASVKGEFIDMGLPSGTLWASKNLGAETPEDYGYYFSWGNFIGRKPSGTTFSYNFGSAYDGPYASTPGAALTGDIPADNDAALRYLGGSARMPTVTQFQELFNSSYTTNEWVADYRGTGVAGRLVTSKINGNKIFFPAAGYGNGTSLYNAGTRGYYWSRSLVSGGTSGYGLSFDSSAVYPANRYNRFGGFSVRAVL